MTGGQSSVNLLVPDIDISFITNSNLTDVISDIQQELVIFNKGRQWEKTHCQTKIALLSIQESIKYVKR